VLRVTSGKSRIISWCHAEDSWQEAVPSEHKGCNPNNILSKQPVENGRKMIGVEQ
jgi:hypothetical protein